MKDDTKYVGLDVSKEKIAVAIADKCNQRWLRLEHRRDSIMDVQRLVHCHDSTKDG